MRIPSYSYLTIRIVAVMFVVGLSPKAYGNEPSSLQFTTKFSELDRQLKVADTSRASNILLELQELKKNVEVYSQTKNGALEVALDQYKRTFTFLQRINPMDSDSNRCKHLVLNPLEEEVAKNTILLSKVDGLILTARFKAGQIGDYSRCATYDCKAYVTGDSKLCATYDCKAYVIGDSKLCATYDCTAYVTGDSKLCATYDCKAYVTGDSKLCASKDCTAYVTGDSKLCASKDCTAYLSSPDIFSNLKIKRLPQLRNGKHIPYFIAK